MKTGQAAPVIVITAQDLPESIAQVHQSYECDCACPGTTQVAHSQTNLAILHNSEVLKCPPNLVEVPLKNGYTALFNPFGPGGVVVTNQAAYDGLEMFKQPVSLAQAHRASIPHGEDNLEKLCSTGILQVDGNWLSPDFQPSPALSVWLQVTNACNLSCPYCYIRKDGQSMAPETGRAALEAVFHSAQLHGFETVRLKYSGGEPSLQGELVLLLHDYSCELAERHGIEFQDVLLSNGVSLSSQFIQGLKAREMRVMISLDGIGDFHDVQRPLASGYGSFERVQQTIESLIKAGLPPHLSITITAHNLEGLPEVVRYALAHNLTFSFNFYRETAPGDPALRYDEAEMIAALCKAFTVIEEELPAWSMLGMLLDRGQLLEPRQRTCGAGQNYIVVDHQGRIAQCHMQMERSLGEVFSTDPVQAIQGAELLPNIAVDEKEGCRECQWRYWCSGGCAVVVQNHRDNGSGRSPNCNIYQAIYPEAIRLEGLRLLKYAKAGKH